MPRPRVYKTQAVVLRQRKLGEADKIVTLFSPSRGKIDAVAKGVRRTKSRMSGHVEPLTFGPYLLAEGRDLDIITQAETVEAFGALRADLGGNIVANSTTPNHPAGSLIEEVISDHNGATIVIR